MKLGKLLSICLFFFSIMNCSAQITFQKTFHHSNEGHIADLQTTSDNGFIMIGSTHQSTNAQDNDIYIIKLNDVGDTVWARAFGDTLADFGYSVKECIGGGFIILGDYESNVFPDPIQW